ncbi:RagB/SusD family nutrient uptake outer membrane protein [Sediminibacterium sp.]|uniref:RagB/SusD family nutrient uptake outer membrane protein n=1 Tax=Sediminibacterium sp. TaxID=1917865 RepID=UPI0025F04196|nr:RagB/SusD family nutrient uptake outer membrane protein [Sediminibacterium sp.]MBW0178985.1 RagB/SusD family nutrient uptake outer membrane protein [Sediminibacterium sp.]
MNTYKRLVYLCCCFCLLTACDKDAFLDKKPNSAIIIPSTLAELRSLLDNTQVFTYSPGLGEMGSDDYYLTEANWQALPFLERSSYTWESDLYGSQLNISDWSLCYQQILYANIVLEQLEKNPPATSVQAEWNNIKGSAFFLRGFALSNLVQHFAAAFDSATMTTTPGVPIRRNTNVHQNVPRSSIKDCYDSIFTDLLTAAALLSDIVPPVAKNRPSKPAAFAQLARMATASGQYEKARIYADSCLRLYNYLTDYNTVSTTAVSPFDRSHAETIYFSQAISTYVVLFTTSTTVFADTALYRSYTTNDLRRSIFFRATGGTNMGFKRGYSGTILPFTGIATDEVWLIRAEALAKTGQWQAAMADLNTLLQKRWRTGTFVPLTALNATDALEKIRTERRKELVWRGHRWSDLKRYNKEGANITLVRKLGNQTYTLLPGSNKYVFAIPANEISMSGIIQNPR